MPETEAESNVPAATVVDSAVTAELPTVTKDTAAAGSEEEKKPLEEQKEAQQVAEAKDIALKLPDVPTSEPGDEEHADKKQKHN